jgi:hypothetical protein
MWESKFNMVVKMKFTDNIHTQILNTITLQYNKF